MLVPGPGHENRLRSSPGVAQDPFQRETPPELALPQGDGKGDLHTWQWIAVLIPHLDNQRRQWLAVRRLLIVARDHPQATGTGLQPLRHVPESDLAVLRPRGERRAIGREGHRGDPPALPPQSDELLLRPRVPQVHGKVSPGCELVPAGGEGHRTDGPIVPFEDGDALARRHLPQPHGGIVSPGGDQGSVR